MPPYLDFCVMITKNIELEICAYVHEIVVRQGVSKH